MARRPRLPKLGLHQLRRTSGRIRGRAATVARRVLIAASGARAARDGPAVLAVSLAGRTVTAGSLTTEDYRRIRERFLRHEREQSIGPKAERQWSTVGFAS